MAEVLILLSTFTAGVLLAVFVVALLAAAGKEAPTDSLWQEQALASAFNDGYDARKREVAAMAAAAKARREGG